VDEHAGPPVSDGIERGATLSPCGRYRYALWRRFGPGTEVVFIGLNPSTADASHDDPTIRRCIGFARRWGHGRLTVVNLFAWRATDPSDLRAAEEPVGPDNMTTLQAAIARADQVIPCWGHLGDLHGQDQIVRRMLPSGARCLGFTKSGQPRHPLFVRYGTELVRLSDRQGRG